LKPLGPFDFLQPPIYRDVMELAFHILQKLGLDGSDNFTFRSAHPFALYIGMPLLCNPGARRMLASSKGSSREKAPHFVLPYYE
jgi:hypothetical protein